HGCPSRRRPHGNPSAPWLRPHSRWGSFAAANARHARGRGGAATKLRTVSGSNVAVLLQHTETNAATALTRRQSGPALRHRLGEAALSGGACVTVAFQPGERGGGAVAEAALHARAEEIDPGLDDVRRRLEVALEGVGGAADAKGLVGAGLTGHQRDAAGRHVERVLVALHDPLRIG